MLQQVVTKPRTRMRSGLRSVVWLCLTGFLAACSTFEYHETKEVKIKKLTDQQEQAIDEQALLDVGIVLFDPGKVDLDEEILAYSSVRQSESVWFTNQLKQTLEQSNAWGLIRALPKAGLPIDVTVTGELIESNGEEIELQIRAVDSTGTEWFNRNYQQPASAYAYHPEVKLPGDPFQATFNQIANDLYSFQAGLSIDARRNIRSVSKVLFARDFVPDAFADYVQEDPESGAVSLLRLPADSDPMMQRVDRIRARNDLFIDVIQDYYRAFNRKMEAPYQEWRKFSYREVVYARQLAEQARKEKIAGLAVMAGGLVAAVEGDRGVTRGAGHIGILSGAQIFINSFKKREQSLVHAEALRELGSSLASELEPSVVDLQDRSITLSGTVDDQFTEWRRILQQMFELEQGESDELPEALR